MDQSSSSPPQFILRAVLRGCQEASWPRELLLPIAAEDSDAPGSSLTWNELDSLLSAACQRAGDPLLPMRIGRQLSEANMHVFGLLIVASTTIREAVSHVDALQRQLSGCVLWHLSEDDDLARYTRACPWLGEVTQSLFLALGFSLLERFVPLQHRQSIAIQLTPDAPGLANYAALFGERVRVGTFEQGIGFAFPRALLDAPRPGTTDRSLALLLRQLAIERLPASAAAGWVSRLENALRTQPQLVSVDLKRLASGWSITARTLRRHIHAEGQTVTEVINRVRFERAQLLLRQGRLPLDQVSAQLGYSETSAFRRAFKRWSGASVEAFRRSGAPDL